MLRGISGVMPKVTTGRLTGLAAAGAGSYGGYKAYHSPGLADAYHTVGDLLSPEGREAMALEATNRHLSTHDPAGMSQSPALPYGSGPNAQLRGEQRAMTSRIGQSAVKKMIPEDLATTVNDKIEAEAKPRIEAHLKALQDKAQKYLAGGISGLSQQAGEGLAGQLSRPGVVAGALGGGALLGGLAGGGGHSGLSGRLRSGLIGGLTAGGGLAGAGLAQHFLPQYGLGGMLGGAALGAVGSNLLGRLVPGGSPSAKRRLPDDEEDD